MKNTHTKKLLITIIIFTLSAGITLGFQLKNKPSETSVVSIEEEGTSLSITSHNAEDDCWTIIDGNIYDITEYVNFHPGGKQQILTACGVDATEAFNTKGGRDHGHLPSTLAILEQYYVGSANEGNETVNTETPTEATESSQTTQTTESQSTTIQTTLNDATLSQHASASSCWLIINNNVYDVTQYIPFHPGGQQRIISYCGKDATQAFNTKGGHGKHSSSASQTLANYYIGSYNASIETPSTSGSNTNGGTSVEKQSPIELIQEQYPGATIKEENYEDDGRVEIKFRWNGETYEAKFDSSGNLIEIDD